MAVAVPAVEPVPGVLATATLVLRGPTTGVFVGASATEDVDGGGGGVPSVVLVVSGLSAPVVCAVVLTAGGADVASTRTVTVLASSGGCDAPCELTSVGGARVAAAAVVKTLVSAVVAVLRECETSPVDGLPSECVDFATAVVVAALPAVVVATGGLVEAAGKGAATVNVDAGIVDSDTSMDVLVSLTTEGGSVASDGVVGSVAAASVVVVHGLLCCTTVRIAATLDTSATAPVVSPAAVAIVFSTVWFALPPLASAQRVNRADDHVLCAVSSSTSSEYSFVSGWRISLPTRPSVSTMTWVAAVVESMMVPRTAARATWMLVLRMPRDVRNPVPMIVLTTAPTPWSATIAAVVA